jgi:hypothetical protein
MHCAAVYTLEIAVPEIRSITEKKLRLITFIPALGDLCSKQQKLDMQRLKFARFLYLAKEIATSKRVNKRRISPPRFCHSVA